MRNNACLSLLVAILVLILSNYQVKAQEEESKYHFKERPRTISITGNADIKVAPDKATVNFSIKNTEKTAEKARINNNDASKAVLNAIRKLGIPEEKIHFENLSIQEDYEYNNKTGQSTLRGYKAYKSFNVEIEKSSNTKLAETVAEIVSAVVVDNSNQLESIEYGLIDREKVKIEVFQLACKNAKEKAEAMLKALGATLGPVKTVSESGSVSPYPRRVLSSAKMFSTASVADQAPADAEAFSEGDLEVNAAVGVVFDIQ